MDSSSLGACRRLGHDATKRAAEALACARRRNDVTRCSGIDMPPRGPFLCEYDVVHKTGKYMTYRNAARRPDQATTMGRATCTQFGEDGRVVPEICSRRTDTHTRSSQYSAGRRGIILSMQLPTAAGDASSTLGRRCPARTSSIIHDAQTVTHRVK